MLETLGKIEGDFAERDDLEGKARRQNPEDFRRLFGGPKGVGDAVNESVVITFMLLFVVNFVMSAIYFQLVPPKTG